MPLRARVQFRGSTVTGDGVSTTYWRQLSLTPSPTELAGISGSLEAFWGVLVNGSPNVVRGVDVMFDGVLEDVSLATGQVTAVYQAPVWTHVRNLTAGPTSRASQGLVRLNTDHWVNGRQLRGRMFIPGIRNAILDGTGDIATNGVNALNDAAANLTIASDGQDWWMSVYSRTHATEAPVTSAHGQSRLAVLRSRRD